jgi:hypothetical protein
MGWVAEGHGEREAFVRLDAGLIASARPVEINRPARQ